MLGHKFRNLTNLAKRNKPFDVLDLANPQKVFCNMQQKGPLWKAEVWALGIDQKWFACVREVSAKQTALKHTRKPCDQLHFEALKSGKQQHNGRPVL